MSNETLETWSVDGRTIYADERNIAYCESPYHYTAPLIAAAPELLHAAEEAWMELDDRGINPPTADGRPLLDVLRTTITKAKGGA